MIWTPHALFYHHESATCWKTERTACVPKSKAGSASDAIMEGRDLTARIRSTTRDMARRRSDFYLGGACCDFAGRVRRLGPPGRGVGIEWE